MYYTDRVFVVFAWLFYGSQIGSCNKICSKLCSRGFGSQVSEDGMQCTCGTKECDVDCLHNSQLLQKIANVTVEKEGLFNQTWWYSPVATLGVDVPMVSREGAILWNYFGQANPPIQLKLTAAEYGFYLDAVLRAVQQLATEAGVHSVQEAYHGYSRTLNESYVKIVGVEYPGTLWDYLEGYGGPNLSWIPHLALLPDYLADPSSPTLQDYQSAFLVPGRFRSLDGASSSAAAAEVCKCRLPPPGCRVDGSDLVALDCLNWPEAPKLYPGGICDSKGFFTDRGDFVCRDIRSNCRGSNDKYQELYSLDGKDVYCCRCTYRQPDDPVADNELCPSGWTSHDAACSSLATGSCKNYGGMWSEVLIYDDDSCCRCDFLDLFPAKRHLSFWDPFKYLYDIISNGCIGVFGPSAALKTTTDVLELAGFRALEGFANVLSISSCGKRADLLASALFLDSKCTKLYTDASSIEMFGCRGMYGGCPQCGLKGYPIRSRTRDSINREVVTTPMTYFLKVDGRCFKKRWDDGFTGTLTWCG